MKGLDLAELFFLEFGLPTIEEHFPGILDRVSAGLLGRGSEVLGADDGLSRDHGWGPRFCLFLVESDFRQIGGTVHATMNGLKPAVFRGFDLRQCGTDAITVSTVDDFYRELTGSPWPPDNVQAWASASENGLCFARAGRVFYDPLGDLQERKWAFEEAYYPESVWKWRIASKLFQLWHYGEYNICSRLARRQDGVATLVGIGHVVGAAMQLAFLLNRQFAPYWKWLHWGFLLLPYLSDALEPWLAALESACVLGARTAAIRGICDLYRGVLSDQGILPDREWRNFLGAFDIVESIHDPVVRKLVECHFDQYKHL